MTLSGNAPGYGIGHGRGGVAETASVRLRRTRAAGRGLWRAGLTGGVALVLAMGVASVAVPPPASRPDPAQPQPAGSLRPWVEISHPLPLFGLSGSPFARLPTTYAARRAASGVERQDVMTFGTFAGNDPFAEIAITRRQTAGESDLVVDVARLAATSGLAVARAGLPNVMQTRFGPFSIAEVTLRQGEDAVPCSGFRLAGQGPVGIVGLACDSITASIDMATITCLIDRIDLVSAGDDDVLRTVFVAAEKRRQGAPCAGVR